MDLFELYKNQDIMKNSELFKKFSKNFSTYFDDTDTYDKNVEGNEYIMTDKKNKKNKKVIKPPVYINLRETYYHLNKEIKNIFDKSLLLIEHRNDPEEDTVKFNEFKLEYKVKVNQLKQCEDIFNDQNKEINKLQNQLVDLKLLLGKKYIERQLMYDKLKNNHIRRISKNKLFKLYKSSNLKIPDRSVVQKVAKKLNVQTDDAMNWLDWFDICKTYIEIQLNIQNNMKTIKKTKEQNNMTNNNFLISAPNVSDKKDVNMNIKVPKVYKKSKDVVVKKLDQ